MACIDRVSKPCRSNDCLRSLKQNVSGRNPPRTNRIPLNLLRTGILTAISHGICLSSLLLMPTAVITTSASSTSLQSTSQCFSASVNSSATIDEGSFACTIYNLTPGRAFEFSESFERFEGKVFSAGDPDLEDCPDEEGCCTDAGRLKGMLFEPGIYIQ